MTSASTAIPLGEQTARTPFSWHTLLTALSADGIAYGFGLYSHGALLIPLAQHFAASRFEISVAFSLSSLSAGLSSLAIGPMLDRRPVKPFMVWGTLLFGGGFILTSYLRSLALLYVVLGGLLGLGCALISQSTSAKFISSRFTERRGRVLALASIGVSLAGVIMPVLGTWLVRRLPVTEVYRLYGIVTLVVLLPLTATIRPDRQASLPTVAATAPAPQRFRELIGTALFWKLVLVFGLSFTVIVVVLVHTLPRVIDSGQGASVAAFVGSAIALLGIPTKLLLSRFADDRRLLVVFCLAVAAQMTGLFLFVESTSYAMNLAGGALFGLGMGAVQPCLAIFTSLLFGRMSVGTVMGLLAPFMYVIQLVGVPLAGHLYDQQGNYRLALWLCIGASGVVLLLALSMRSAMHEAAAKVRHVYS